MAWYVSSRLSPSTLDRVILRVLVRHFQWCPLTSETWTWTWKIFIRQEKKYKHDTISHRVHDSMFFVVGRPLQRRWAHRLRKGHPRVLQCINRHCTMKGQTFGSVGKLNTHTSWDRAPSRLTRGTQLTIITSGKETKTYVLNTTS